MGRREDNRFEYITHVLLFVDPLVVLPSMKSFVLAVLIYPIRHQQDHISHHTGSEVQTVVVQCSIVIWGGNANVRYKKRRSGMVREVPGYPRRPMISLSSKSILCDVMSSTSPVVRLAMNTFTK